MENKNPIPATDPSSFYKKVAPDLYPYMVREVAALTLLKKAKVPDMVLLKSVDSDGSIELQKHDGDLADIVPSDDDDIIRAVYRILVMLCNLNNVHLYHRDIKPENILSSNDGKHLVLCDFGLARYYSCGYNPEQCTSYVQTSGFRAPELFFKDLKLNTMGPLNPRNMDIWSLGITALQLLEFDDFIAHNESLKLSELYDIYCEYYLPGGTLETFINVCPDELAEFLRVVAQMLTMNPDHRPDPEQLIADPIFDSYREHNDIMDVNSLKAFERERVDQLLSIIPSVETNPEMINHLTSINCYNFNNVESCWLAVCLLYRLPAAERTDIMGIIAVASAIFDTDVVDVPEQVWLDMLQKFDCDLMLPVMHPEVVQRLTMLFSTV